MFYVDLIKMKYISCCLLFILIVSCSHDYESNSLDLGKYQWNMWPDPEAGAEPSCGWEVLNRGNGKLVRIPAVQDAHFSSEEQSQVVWFHVRHTLPELWEHREISLKFEGLSQEADVYLNDKLVGSIDGSDTPITMDISDRVYYVRDNHLQIRVKDSNPESCGISGNIIVVSTPLNQVPGN